MSPQKKFKFARQKFWLTDPVQTGKRTDGQTDGQKRENGRIFHRVVCGQRLHPGFAKDVRHTPNAGKILAWRVEIETHMPDLADKKNDSKLDTLVSFNSRYMG